MDISKDLIDYLDMRYVKQTSCAERHEKLEKDIGEMKVSAASNATQLKNNTKLLWVAASSGITTAISVIGSIVVFFITRR